MFNEYGVIQDLTARDLLNRVEQAVNDLLIHAIRTGSKPVEILALQSQVINAIGERFKHAGHELARAAHWLDRPEG